MRAFNHWYLSNQQISSARRNAIWFTPGVTLILVGLVALLAPQLVIAVLATIFVFAGAVVCFLGWKLIQLKNKVEKFAKQFDGRVVIQGVNLQTESPPIELPEQKKIVFH